MDAIYVLFILLYNRFLNQFEQSFKCVNTLIAMLIIIININLINHVYKASSFNYKAREV